MTHFGVLMQAKFKLAEYLILPEPWTNEQNKSFLISLMLQTYATAAVICQTSGLKDPQSCQGLNSVLVAAPVKMNIASTSESEASVEYMDSLSAYGCKKVQL